MFLYLHLISLFSLSGQKACFKTGSLMFRVIQSFLIKASGNVEKAPRMPSVPHLGPHGSLGVHDGLGSARRRSPREGLSSHARKRRVKLRRARK